MDAHSTSYTQRIVPTAAGKDLGMGDSLENFNEDIQKLVPQMLELRLSAAWDFSLGVSLVFCLSLYPYICSPAAEMSFLKEARQGGSQELGQAAIHAGLLNCIMCIIIPRRVSGWPCLGSYIYLPLASVLVLACVAYWTARPEPHGVGRGGTFARKWMKMAWDNIKR